MGGTTGRRRRPNPVQYLHEMIHGRETAYNSKMAIQSMGSKFGTNNETVDDIEMSRNVYRNEVSYSFRSRNLGSRVGRKNS